MEADGPGRAAVPVVTAPPGPRRAEPAAEDTCGTGPQALAEGLLPPRRAGVPGTDGE
ncbi:hypothetical protein ACGF7W_18695 [Streptomyces sp. NPDC048219]|uniref:hypothetical protein n=1 Tax=Streptomyces sp. NPDC048219 TaxID=3365517 RepID=UPI0037129166